MARHAQSQSGSDKRSAASGDVFPGTSSSHIPAAQLATLLKVSAALSSSLDLAHVLQTAIESAAEVLGLGTGAIYTIDGDDLRLGATTPPLPPDFPDELRCAHLADHPHILETITTGTPLYVRDIRKEPLTDGERMAVDGRGLVTCVYVPLIAKELVEGVFILGSTDTICDFPDDHMDLTRTLASQIAMAVMNAQLYDSVLSAKREVDAAYDATIAGWSNALEMRDAGTAVHTQRVADLTERLARRMGIPESEMQHVRRGALLHDIGKMVVPDAILHKPSALDDAEWIVMRRHAENAKELLSNIEYLAPAADIPHCHHERWDGLGYPQGLAGEDIPIAARIFAVIDVYDALTSERPYRSAWSIDAALQHIRAQSGSHFDPAVVDAFIAMADAGEI